MQSRRIKTCMASGYHISKAKKSQGRKNTMTSYSVPSLHFPYRILLQQKTVKIFHYHTSNNNTTSSGGAMAVGLGLAMDCAKPIAPKAFNEPPITLAGVVFENEVHPGITPFPAPNLNLDLDSEVLYFWRENDTTNRQA